MQTIPRARLDPSLKEGDCGAHWFNKVRMTKTFRAAGLNLVTASRLTGTLLKGEPVDRKSVV